MPQSPLTRKPVLRVVGVGGAGVNAVDRMIEENACASGGSAVHLAWQAIAAGLHERVLVVGVENLSAFGGGTLPLSTADIEIDQGMVMPAAYAMRAQRYLHDFGAGIDALTAVSVKNRGNGADNPRAHFQAPVTASDVRAVPAGGRSAAAAALLPEQRRRRGGAADQRRRRRRAGHAAHPDPGQRGALRRVPHRSTGT